MSYPYDSSGRSGAQDQPQPGFAPLEYPPQSGLPPIETPPPSAYSQQSGYPQQPGFPPPAGYPQQPSAAYPGYPTPPMYSPYAIQQTKASGGTAITAGVLAMIAGVLSILVAIVMLIASAAVSSDDSSYRDGTGYRHHESGLVAVLIGFGVLVLVVGALWCTGATMLFLRKAAGRWILIVMSALAVVLGVISFAIRPGSGAIGLIFSIAILVLASVPPTGRWIAEGKQPAVPAQPYYPYY
ncbi:hypothetical protein [Nocardia sp. NPDC004722]